MLYFIVITESLLLLLLLLLYTLCILLLLLTRGRTVDRNHSCAAVAKRIIEKKIYF